MSKLELLAPAGDLEKLKIAIIYGADAVYFGGEDFSLRAAAGGFTKGEMLEGIEFAHERDKKCYLALNIFAHNDDIPKIKNYLAELRNVPIDGILVSDPGIFMLVKEYLPNMEIHLSTQANLTNYETAKFWKEMGMKRLVLARELSLKEIKEIRDNISFDIELEAFIHGAMCISYSGRCLLSNVMIGRDANQGACAHPCRYEYALMEEKRPGEFFPIEEDSRGTYIMNSKDLCMIHNINDLAKAGIYSLKIEGRMKTIYYVATVVGAYRRALDSYNEASNPDEWKLDEDIFHDLCKASHREFTTGFYYGKTTEESQNYSTSSYIKDYSFVGILQGVEQETGLAICEQRNKFQVGEEIEFFGPDGNKFVQTIEEMMDFETRERIEAAPHAQQKLLIRTERPVGEFYMMRRKER